MPKAGTRRNAAASDPAMPPSVLSDDSEPMVRPAVSIDLHDAPMARGNIAPMQSAGGKTTVKLAAYRKPYPVPPDMSQSAFGEMNSRIKTMQKKQRSEAPCCLCRAVAPRAMRQDRAVFLLWPLRQCAPTARPISMTLSTTVNEYVVLVRKKTRARLHRTSNAIAQNPEQAQHRREKPRRNGDSGKEFSVSFHGNIFAPDPPSQSGPQAILPDATSKFIAAATKSEADIPKTGRRKKPTPIVPMIAPRVLAA